MSGKLIGLGLVVVLSAVTALNCFTIISVGAEASVASFGEVHKNKNLTGFNWVLPHWDIDEFSGLLETNEYSDVGIPSQDKFKTSMDIVFTGKFLKGSADVIRATTGTESEFLDNHIYKRVLSCGILAGGAVLNSQAFYSDTVQMDMSNSIRDCVNDYVASIGGGYELTSVTFKDINLDTRVVDFMVKTKDRQQAEETQQSEFNIAALKSAEKTKIAEENAKASVFAKAAAKNVSDSKFYDITKQAEGNIKLAKSTTPELNDYIKAQRWDGKLPTHQLGTNSSVFLK